MVEAAARAALTAPRGPVSLEIPIDVQREKVAAPAPYRLSVRSRRMPPIRSCSMSWPSWCGGRKRPMLWLGGGAREAAEPARDLAERGFAVVTSTNGRAVVPEAHPHTLGAYNMTPEAQAIYDRADLMIVVGSRLRGNETRNNAARLPHPLIQIDADAGQAARNYAVDLFINADAAAALDGAARAIAGAARGRREISRRHRRRARKESERKLAAALGPYRAVADALQARVARGAHPFVRDVTLSNSTFGNRYVHLAAPHLGVHALGGGIGQGIAMAVGAALAGAPAKTIALLGDGGAMVNLGELATAVDSQGRHRLRADERPRLRRHPQHPGCAVRRPPPLRRSAHAGLFAAGGGARRCRISGCRASRTSRRRSTVPWRRAGRNWSKSTWWRSARSPSRLPGRRRAPRAARDGADMTSILTRLRQPLRRGEVEDLRGIVIDEPIDLQGAELPNLDFSGATFNAPLATARCGLPGAGLV